ncbi:uncharacterized protein LOC109845694 [Asparagus officinalis]|uniref:uncharacterized protein LOC109845694 n=1 Tax=Asparagus officinalis TaxID=4686 RepID=UPI00098E0357|nr:uncharacterized protein LOC109845694 [Asparagus officinalis]
MEDSLIVPNVSSQSSEHIEQPYESITIEESERIPNDNPQGEHVYSMNDVVSDSSRIPAWWHEAITGKGQQFESAKEVRMALIYYSIAKKFAFKYVNNEPKRIRASCMFREETNCPWLFFASPLSHVSTFAIKKFVPQHTCGQHNSTAGHFRASRRWIASMLQSIMKRRPYITPTDIRKELHSQYGLRVNYSKAWRAKETAKDEIFGCARHSYDLLSWYQMKVTETNPGSVFSIEQEERRFKRLFVSYGACIQGFLKGCRPLLFLDGTFLKDRYKGILLGATAYDGNQGIFPLAFSVCDQENEANWSWFIQGLRYILYNRTEPYNPPHPLVILSDADKGIKQSLKNIFPDAYHSRCVLHLVENYKLKLREMGFTSSAAQRISKLLEFAAYKYTDGEFNAVLRQIRMTDQRAYQVALSYGPSNWANSVFPGIRYGHITSNVAESFNSWIRVARTLPICDMMDHIRVQIMERMNTRREMATKWNSYLCPEAEKILQENVTKGSTLEVSHSTAEIFEVSSQKSVQVDLEHKTCTCRVWDILRIPCKHACVAINFMHRDVYQFCDWFMTTEAFRRSYEPILFLVPIYDKPDVTDETISILPPKTTKRRGRNKNRRINNRSESRRAIRCSRCHAEGHNRATCTEPIED